MADTDSIIRIQELSVLFLIRFGQGFSAHSGHKLRLNSTAESVLIEDSIWFQYPVVVAYLFAGDVEGLNTAVYLHVCLTKVQV